MSAHSIAAGEEIAVTVTARNPSGGPVRLARHGCSAIGFEILGPTGERVYPAGREPDCAVMLDEGTALSGHVIPAHDAFSFTYLWAAVEGYATTAGSGTPLPAGAYQVVPRIDLAGEIVRGDPALLTITD